MLWYGLNYPGNAAYVGLRRGGSTLAGAMYIARYIRTSREERELVTRYTVAREAAKQHAPRWRTSCPCFISFSTANSRSHG